MSKKIKVMTEYNYFPLWDMETADNLEAEDLPLSLEISEKLADWGDIYDQIINWDDPSLSGFKSEQDKINFEKQGVILAIKIQEELGFDYQVFFFSEIQQKLFSDQQLKNYYQDMRITEKLSQLV